MFLNFYRKILLFHAISIILNIAVVFCEIISKNFCKKLLYRSLYYRHLAVFCVYFLISVAIIACIARDVI